MHRFAEAKQLLSSLGIAPAYIVGPLGNSAPLNDAQERLLEFQDDTIAMISPTTDLWFKDTGLRYDWAGRGCCIVFCQNPFSFGLQKFLGTCLHEAGHWLDFFDNASRDDSDYERAKRAGTTKGYGHTPRWLRATVHLWHRACRMGYEIPFDNVVNLGQYGFSHHDLLPVLDESSARESEDIESILRSAA